MFGGEWRDTGVTPSDIVAGLAIVRASYLAQEPKLPPPAPPTAAEQQKIDEEMIMLAHLSKYMIGVYGHLLYMFSHLSPPIDRSVA